MFSKFSYIQKNKFLLPVAGLGILLCWFFAFNKTFEAIKLNNELKSQAVTSSDLSFNPLHTEKKLAALKSILKSYRVNPSEWSNELWMKASSIAMKQQVGIDYTKSKPIVEKDTTITGISETIYCYGQYIQLVKLIDTLERTPAIGKISALQVRAPKEDVVGARAGQCVLRIEFRGITEL